MTDPRMRVPESNYAHYSANPGYERNEARFREDRVKWISRWLRAARPNRVLDLGCNDGFLAQLLPDDVHYVGMELNPVAIENAYPNARGRIVCANACTDALGGPWDCVIAAEVLEHVPDPALFLARVRTSLAPKGLLLSTSAMGNGEAHEPGNEEHLREWTLQEFCRLHERNWFRVIDGSIERVYEVDGVYRWSNCVAAERLPFGDRNDAGVGR